MHDRNSGASDWRVTRILIHMIRNSDVYDNNCNGYDRSHSTRDLNVGIRYKSHDVYDEINGAYPGISVHMVQITVRLRGITGHMIRRTMRMTVHIARIALHRLE